MKKFTLFVFSFFLLCFYVNATKLTFSHYVAGDCTGKPYVLTVTADGKCHTFNNPHKSLSYGFSTVGVYGSYKLIHNSFDGTYDMSLYSDSHCNDVITVTGNVFQLKTCTPSSACLLHKGECVTVFGSLKLTK